MTFDFELHAPSGPSLYQHAGSVLDGDRLFVHGGVSNPRSQDPVDTLSSLDISSGLWSSEQVKNSPKLSGHCAVSWDSNNLLLIGGWNGKRRTAGVYRFDRREGRFDEVPSSGFPEGAGLSSHSVQLLSQKHILVVGREGGLRTQRRCGNAFMLCGDLTKGFHYNPAASGIGSRSGHTMAILRHRKTHILTIVGGRDDNFCEQHSGRGFETSSAECSVISDVCGKIVSRMKPINPSDKSIYRRHHVCLSGGEFCLLHGGERFDGRVKGPNSEVVLIRYDGEVFRMGNCSVAKAGHLGFVDSMGNGYIHGGAGADGSVYGHTYKLVVKGV